MKKIWIPIVPFLLGAEIVLWAILAFSWPWLGQWISETTFFRGFEITYPSLKHFLPKPSNEGYGSMSFITLATGFNVALVKFEMFRKSLDDVRKYWQDSVDKRVADANLEDYMADDKVVEMVRERKENHLQTIYEQNEKCWLKGRCWALRMLVLGGIILFYNHSGGVLAIPLIFPAIYTWICKTQYTSSLTDQVDATLTDLKAFVKIWKSLKEETRAEIGTSVKKGL